MKIFKFGGASVRNAEAVKNVGKIIRMSPNEKVVVVVSAMGKTTNAMEGIAKAFFKGEQTIFFQQIEECENYHFTILQDLFDEKHSIHKEISLLFSELKHRFHKKKSENFDFEYDQIVSLGEVISTQIIHAYLQNSKLKSAWIDARKTIRTDNQFREGEVNWAVTQQLVQSTFLSTLEEQDIAVTQGFLGHTEEGFSTTLGREGSDYTAGILAFCLNATSVTIWKDVPGMLNADPKQFKDTVKLKELSFKEAIELSYYGASVIHPKTLKPLQNKRIPLFIKSFLQPTEEGTVIQNDIENKQSIPSFILKSNQILISLQTKDFSFIVEKHLSDIFQRLSEVGAKINLMQNTALNFSVLLDEEKINLKKLTQLFSKDYFIEHESNLELITIRHFNDSTISRITEGKKVIVEQKIKATARLVVRKN